MMRKVVTKHNLGDRDAARRDLADLEALGEQ
jgi:hypothetical protein